MCGLLTVGLLAGCGSSTHGAAFGAPVTSTTAMASLQQQFQTDNAPFLDALRANQGWAAYEQSAGDAGHLLSADHWSASCSADVSHLAADYQIIANGGTDYTALNVALGKWKTAYDQAAGDLSLPQPFAS